MHLFTSFGLVSAAFYLHFICTSAVRYVLEKPQGGIFKEGDQIIFIMARFGRLWIKDSRRTVWLDKSQNPKISPLKKCRRSDSLCFRLEAKNFERVIFEGRTEEMSIKMHKKLTDFLDHLDEPWVKGPTQQISDLTPLGKNQEIAVSDLPQLVTGLKCPNCYNPGNINRRLEIAAGSSISSFIITNEREKLLLQVGGIEEMSLQRRCKISFLYENTQTQNAPQVSILWPQDKRSAALLKLDTFIYKAPERHPMFHVLYSGNFRGTLKSLLEEGHSSLSVLGPFAHAYTLLRADPLEAYFNNHFPSATYNSGHSSIRLVPNDFSRDSSTFATLLREAPTGSRMTVLKGKPYFQISESELYRYEEPHKRYDTSLVFGSGFEIDLKVKPQSIKRKRDELLTLMINEYKHTIMAALTAGFKVQVIYLQPLVDPNDKQLFKLSLSALGTAITELSKSFKLIPVKLIFPLLSPRDFHRTYDEDMINTLREYIPHQSVISIEKMSFSENKQQFITKSTKSSPRQRILDPK